jgi:hypothetical protein
MIQFLEDLKGLGKLPLSHGEREELEQLRADHARLIAKISKGDKKVVVSGAGAPKKKADSDASSESDG